MKKGSIKYIIIVLACISLSACTKLTEEPYSAISTEQFYKTESDALAGLAAAYAQLVEVYNTAGTCASDWSADQTFPRQAVGRNTITLFTYDANYTVQRSFTRVHESPQQLWNSCYAGIEKSNWVIAKVAESDINEATRNAIVGDALFLRAFYHFTLTKNFGDVIIKIEPSEGIESAFLPKSPKAEVYNQIFKDLEEAEAKLPSWSASTVKGRSSKETAMGLHAKAALYAENWPVALQKAQAVIQSGKFSLMENVLDVYDVTKEDAARVENMWAYEAESMPPAKSHQLLSLYGPPNSDGPDYGVETYGSIFAYQSFYDSFDPEDERRLLLDTTYVNRAGNVVSQKDISPATTQAVLVKKYMDKSSLGALGANNIPILRFADMYLIAAEAAARATAPSAEAYQYVNTVRARAGLADLPNDLTQQQFIDSVLQERSWEFFAEGDRWYDLTRTNTFMQVIPKAVNDLYPVRTPQQKHRYFPIPQDEINANDQLEQNPEWR
ncbi:MAG: RagB/SusD family nutrient uptake outer membrane protein [Flavitalea sp.]